MDWETARKYQKLGKLPRALRMDHRIRVGDGVCIYASKS
jgi:hypothetical protein